LSPESTELATSKEGASIEINDESHVVFIDIE
jgi:hypothetical protein